MIPVQMSNIFNISSKLGRKFRYGGANIISGLKSSQHKLLSNRFRYDMSKCLNESRRYAAKPLSANSLLLIYSWHIVAVFAVYKISCSVHVQSTVCTVIRVVPLSAIPGILMSVLFKNLLYIFYNHTLINQGTILS